MRKAQIPRLELRAGFTPGSYNEKRNTIELVWTTGAKVLRSPWFGEPYYEELAVDDKSVRMSRLENGAPLLNNHSSWSLEDVIGSVERAWIADGKGHAEVRLSKRPEIAGIVQDIREGVIRNVSVGYQVHRYEKQSAPEGVSTNEIPTYRAVDWEPMEISFVGIPADAGAQSRSAAPTNECVLSEPNQKGVKTMAKKGAKTRTQESVVSTSPEVVEETTTPVQSEGEQVAPVATETAPVTEGEVEERAATPTPAPAPVAQANAEEIRAQEIERGKQIRAAVRAARLPEAFADGLVADANVTVEKAREAVIAELEKQTSTETNTLRIERGGMDIQQTRREAATRVLLHQFDQSKFKLENGDSEVRAHGILSMARKILAMEGVRNAHDMSPLEVATRALHSSSDFPFILENVANKALRAAYDAAPNTYAPFVSQRNVSDFKEISSLSLSAGSKLEKVNEHGEVKRGTMRESKEKYVVETFGKILGLTRKAIVNDDLGAFTSIPANLGLRARQKENEIFWGMILANKVMAETGSALFHANHKNLAAVAAAIDITPLGVARASMRSQLDLDKEPINITPSYLVVPTSLETKADQFVSQITPNQSGQVNPFANRLQVLAEPRLDAGSAISWYVFADKSKIAMGEMALLDGQGPRISVREGFEIEGAETKIVYDFGMTLLDYRGFFKNAGV